MWNIINIIKTNMMKNNNIRSRFDKEKLVPDMMAIIISIGTFFSINYLP
jgi:hypothetical protein